MLQESLQQCGYTAIYTVFSGALEMLWGGFITFAQGGAVSYCLYALSCCYGFNIFLYRNKSCATLNK